MSPASLLKIRNLVNTPIYQSASVMIPVPNDELASTKATRGMEPRWGRWRWHNARVRREKRHWSRFWTVYVRWTSSDKTLRIIGPTTCPWTKVCLKQKGTYSVQDCKDGRSIDARYHNLCLRNRAQEDTRNFFEQVDNLCFCNENW